MLSRKLAGTFVCLSCRVQQAGAKKSQRLLRVSTSANSTPSTLRRRYATDATEARENGTAREVDVDWGKFGDLDELDIHAIENEVGPVDSKEVKEFLSRDRLARRVFQPYGGKPVLQDGEPVPIDILGQAAQAIILRRGGQWQREGDQAVEDGPVAVRQVDIATTLERDNADPNLAEILKNIHDLQPLKTRVLPDVEIKALKLVLSRGFTAPQLRSYIQYTRSTVDFEEGSQIPWVLHKTMWSPQRPEHPPFDLSPDSTHEISKHEAVEQLVGECWGLVAESKQSSEGYIDTRLREVEFSLLSLGNKRWLNQVARYYKDFPRQIELYPATKVLRIIASRNIAEAMLKDVNAVLTLTKTTSHDRRLVTSGTTRPDILKQVLQQVGDVTNSVVRLDPVSNTINISWIHKVNHLDDFEDLSDIVVRFLLSTLGPYRVETKTLGVWPKGARKLAGRYIPDHENAHKLQWKERTRDWARWVLPKIRPKGPPANEGVPVRIWSELLNFEAKFALKEHSPVAGSLTDITSQLAMSAPVAPRGWSREMRHSTRAVYGHVLHSPNDGQPLDSNQPYQKIPLKLTSSIDNAFVPVFPPLPSLVFEKYYRRDRPRHSTLLLRFLPAPDQDASICLASPPLELRLEMDGDELRQVLSLRAVFDTFEAKVLYPERPVDMCITQQRFYEMAGADMDSSQMSTHSVQAFLRSSALKLASGSLHTPARLSGLQLPRRILRPKRRVLIPGKGNDDAVDFLKVDYRFSGLEIQHAMAAEYEGFTLWYTQTEAGQHGGNRSELALEDAPPDKTEAAAFVSNTPDNIQRKDLVERFLRAAARLVSKQGDCKGI